MRPLESTLQQLVAIDSSSQRTNAPMVDYLERRLGAGGFECERVQYIDEHGVPKFNLLARKGKGEPKLALVGHTDCVPFDLSWKEALTLTAKEGSWYGRGSCDTKGFIACALHAAERANPKEPLLLIFTADEELGCIGAQKLVDERKGRARFAIIGEPTGLTPVRAHKGYCLAEVTVLGTEGHSAYPERGASAIFHAARLLRRLEELSLTELRVRTDPAFDPPYGTLNVGLISGGTAKNVIPGQCRFTLEWRPLPSQPVDEGQKLLEKAVAELAQELPGLRCEWKLVCMDRGVDTPESSELVRFLSQRSGKAPAVVAFGTEAPQLSELGAQAVVFGPGSIEVAHTSHEHVAASELYTCEEILFAAIAHFCG